MEKKFHLGDILSITAEVNVSLEGVGGFHKLLDFIIGRPVCSGAITTVNRKCKEHIFTLHPQLKGVSSEEVTRDNWQHWLNQQITLFGKKLPITPIPK